MSRVQTVRIVPPLCVLVAALLIASCGRFSPQQDLASIGELLDSGDINTAQVHLLNLLQKEPESAEARLLLARTEFLVGAMDNAVQDLQLARTAGASGHEVAELDARIKIAKREFSELLANVEAGESGLSPDKVDLFRGRALLGLGRVPEALAAFSKAADQSPGDAMPHVYMSDAHTALQRWERAREAADRALQLQPQEPAALLRKGTLALRQGDTEEARRALAQAHRAAGQKLTIAERSSLLAAEASLAMDAGEWEVADLAWSELARIAPQSLLSELLAAEISLARLDAASAVSRLEALVLKTPELPAPRAVLAEALIQAGRLDRAAQELGQLTTMESVGSMARAAEAAIRQANNAEEPRRTLTLAQALLILEQPRIARTVLEQAIGGAADPKELEVALTQVLLHKGDGAAALERAQTLQKTYPDAEAVHIVLARAHLAMGSDQEAASAYARAWELRPSAATAIGLATARNRAGMPDALAPLQQWTAANPADIAARLVLADMQSRLGQSDQAVSGYEAVIAAQPRNPLALNNLAMEYQRRGDRRALQTARLAHEVAPNAGEITDTYAWLLASSGQAEEAVPLLEGALRRGTVLPEVRYHYAGALARRNGPGDAETARLWLEDLLENDGAFSERAGAEMLLQTLLRPPANSSSTSTTRVFAE